ncbi:hypothetical protein PR048_023626 [Dryococelus australis]|uniref:Uncharacterized protein n=1 Tax=Dryococelus australis TaxID=614101 RepID=A0ABQ9GUN2_9NEOP|nr:hypothetical protein PR048_023626 [Dryococelus australis]
MDDGRPSRRPTGNMALSRAVGEGADCPGPGFRQTPAADTARSEIKRVGVRGLWSQVANWNSNISCASPGHHSKCPLGMTAPRPPFSRAMKNSGAVVSTPAALPTFTTCVETNARFPSECFSPDNIFCKLIWRLQAKSNAKLSTSAVLLVTVCRWSAGFLGDLPFHPPLHSGAAPYSLRFTLIGSQDHATHSAFAGGRAVASLVVSELADVIARTPAKTAGTHRQAAACIVAEATLTGWFLAHSSLDSEVVDRPYAITKPYACVSWSLETVVQRRATTVLSAVCLHYTEP